MSKKIKWMNVFRHSPNETEGMSKCVGVKEIEKMTIQYLLEGNYKKSAHNCHYIPQSEYIFDIDRCRVCDDILVREELTDQLKSLIKRYGIGYKNSSVFSVRIHPAECEAIDFQDLPPKTLQIINERYKDDFTNFGYEMIVPNISQL